MTTCINCNRVYEYSKRSGHNRTKCNSCVVNIRRFAVKQKCVDYLGGKCKICNYSKCKWALVFHHVDPKTKKFEIGNSHCRKWSDIEAELNKCILLCQNCHAELHFKEYTRSYPLVLPQDLDPNLG